MSSYEEGEWKMNQASGIIIFVGGILVMLLLMLLLRAKLNSKRAKKKPALFAAMHRAVEEAVPQAKGYPVVMAQAEKDTMSLLKEAGGDFTKQFAVAAVGAVLGSVQYIPMETSRPNSSWPTAAMKSLQCAWAIPVTIRSRRIWNASCI